MLLPEVESPKRGVSPDMLRSSDMLLRTPTKRPVLTRRMLLPARASHQCRTTTGRYRYRTLSAYARPARCPVLTEGIGWPAKCAPATRYLVLRTCMLLPGASASDPSLCWYTPLCCLRDSYAMSGTDLAYAATAFARAMPCPVLT
eukprot:722193-Rhodomonas_salina.4